MRSSPSWWRAGSSSRLSQYIQPTTAVMTSAVPRPELGARCGSPLWRSLSWRARCPSTCRHCPFWCATNLHASVGSAGVILGICAALEIPALLGFGVLSTRVPLQLLLRIGPLFGVAYFAIASVAGQVWELGAAQLLNACFIALIQGLGISYVQELLPSQPGRASTLYSNTFPCGIILASPLLGIGAQFGYRYSFLSAIGLSVGGLVLLTVGRLSRHSMVDREPSIAAPARGAS